MAEQSVAWFHSDARGLAVAVPAALALAQAMQIGRYDYQATDQELARNLRAQLVGAFAVIDALSTKPQKPFNGSPTIVQYGARTAADFASADRRACADAIASVIVTLYAAMARTDIAPGQPGGPPRQRVTTTEDGSPAAFAPPPGVDPSNVAFGWPAAAAVIGLGLCALAAYIADRISVTSAANEAKRQATALALAKQAQLVTIAKNHLDAEAAAGKPLPFNAAETAAIEDLKNVTRTWQETLKAELPSIFPDLSKTGPSIVERTASTINFAVVVGAFALVYVLTRR